jgi:hypothetical protein
MAKENIYMCYPKVDIVNRERRRKFEFESERVVEEFGRVEDTFLQDLFAEEPDPGQIKSQEEFEALEHHPFYCDYQEIYQDSLEEFVATYEWLLNNGKLRITTLNEHYFPQMFKPLEGKVGCGTLKQVLIHDWKHLTRPIRQLFTLKDLEEEECLDSILA